jgi:hypothetical protein
MKSYWIHALLASILVVPLLGQAIVDTALNKSGQLDNALALPETRNAQTPDSSIDSIKNNTINSLNSVRVIRASYNARVTQGIKSGDSYLINPAIVYLIGEMEIDEIRNELISKLF